MAARRHARSRSADDEGRQIVCFHDANLARVPANVDEQTKKLGVEKLPLAELQKLDVGSFRGPQYAGQRIPTLESILAEMRGHPERLLYLDIKTVDLDQLAELVREVWRRAAVIFTTDALRADSGLEEADSRIADAALERRHGRGRGECSPRKWTTCASRTSTASRHLQIHVHVGDLASDEPFDPSSQFLRTLGEELKSRGIVFQVLPWECSDPRAYEKLLALGAESFATDYPEVTLDAVQDFPRQEIIERSRQNSDPGD